MKSGHFRFSFLVGFVCVLLIFFALESAAELRSKGSKSNSLKETESPEAASTNSENRVSKKAGKTSVRSMENPLSLVATLTQNSQSDGSMFWVDRNVPHTTTVEGRPRKFRPLRLDTAAFKNFSQRVPTGHTQTATATASEFSLPLPDGEMMRFDVEESPILEASLAARYPEIKTFRGQGIDDRTATTRFDFTPQGFHAIVLTTRGTILIEPDNSNQTENYISYFQSEMPAGAMTCDVSSQEQEKAYMPASNEVQPAAVSGTSLRTYRLALAATAEYTQRYGSGTVAGGLAAVTTTINLVDAIYEREVAVRFVFVSNEDSLIFTDAATDGYTSDNASAMLSENQTKLDAVIGDANYDVGHVFDGRSAASGFSFQGIATLGAVCRSGLKARGVSITRSVLPSSVIAYYSTSHEMGHQFGASHTFNATSGACASQRAPSTAYEPGTGSTIMGYRFTCAPEDMMSSDTYFHHASLEQITTNTTVGLGSCPTPVPTGNGIPTVTAGANYTIPRETPFILTASASDPDGDALTYCWEEHDLGTAGPPNTDDGSRPIFRSYAPTSNPFRIFPQGANQGANVVPFESFPLTTRTMNFRVVVRDNRASGGAINQAGMQLNVTADAGPFNVISPSSGMFFPGGSTQSIIWNVANTTAPPVSCSAVKISMSTDGGMTYPIILANNTPNDGSENVTIPTITSLAARIKVEAVGNVFFNVSPIITTSGASSVPTITNFSPQSASVGGSVTITGTNFITPSAVRFNGIDANFTVDSTTQITAIVPAGNTNGQITVITPSGTATSSGTFTGPASYSVSGHIADGGSNAVAGVMLDLQMNFQGTITHLSLVTDASGNFASSDLGCQNNVLVTPFKIGYGFSPLAMSFTSGNCLTGAGVANFTASLAGANSVHLSQSNYNVSEAGTSLTATVTRTGDTSGSASVEFRTTDTDTFTVGCSDRVNNMGAAFGRCDYATTVDTLIFAAGQTSKDVTVPIINDAFAEGNETFGLSLSNAAGSTLTSPATATVTINDDDAFDGPNPIFTTPFFVRQHYLDFLSREPEQGEPWSAVLNSCSDVNNNPACDRLTVSAAFFGSPEFQLKGYYVYRFYKLAFDRLPTYSEIVVDMRAVTGETPNEVFQKKAAFANAFVQWTEFTNSYNALSNAAYVGALMGRYSLTQVTTPDPAFPDGTNKITLTTTDLTNQLNGATLTRAQVLRAIADSDQVANLEFNPAFVAMQYYGYLRRTPEFSGFNAWLNYLNANPTDFRTMVNGFMNSVEYNLRFGP